MVNPEFAARLPMQMCRLRRFKVNTKSIWLSKTFWFNALALVILVANAFGFAEFMRDPAVDQYALIIITLVNIGLRMLTKRPVKVTL